MVYISMKNKYSEDRYTSLDSPFCFLSIDTLFVRVSLLCEKPGSKKDDKVSFSINIKIELFPVFFAQFKYAQKC